jgi:hypothetical protein
MLSLSLSLSGGKLFFFSELPSNSLTGFKRPVPIPPYSLPAIFFVVVAVVVWMLSLFRFRVSFFSSL